MHHGYILTKSTEFLTMKQVKYQKRYHTQDEFDQFTLHLDDEVQIKARTRELKKPDHSSIWRYVGFAGDLGFTIAIPIAGGAFAGGVIDAKMATYPKMTLSLLSLGIIISMLGFIRIIRDLMKPKL